MNGDFFQQWRAADRLAHEFEKAVARASLDSLDGTTQPPPHDAKDRAHKLRSKANELFQMAMAEMKNRVNHSRW